MDCTSQILFKMFQKYSKHCLSGPPPLPDAMRYIYTLLTSTENESEDRATLGLVSSSGAV